MRERIVIVPYDPAWPARFQQLGSALRSALGETAWRIDHIGSTSVRGLAAKPVIDIQISVRSFELLDAFRVPLEQLGYVFRADNPERTKRYFREPPGTPRIHIHVRQAGSWSEQFALLFRDYMRAHSDDAARYADLKRRLAAQYGTDGHGYTDAKAPFIWAIMALADEWNQRIGWQSGASDA